MLSNALKVRCNLNALYLLLAIFSLTAITEAEYFENCDKIQYLQANRSHYVYSPEYPFSYPRFTSCRYKLIAPLNHNINVKCSIHLDKDPNNCTTEYFYMSVDGDKYLRDSEHFCGISTFTRTSLFRTLTMAYISEGSYGNFICRLTVQPQPCDCGLSVNTKIVNGEEASVNEYPSMVALKDIITDTIGYCGASIISYRHLLTAAHCLQFQENPAFIEAHVGRHNLLFTSDTKYAAVYYISKIIVHPEFNQNPSENDIAIFITTEDIEYSRGVLPICLPPPSNANNSFADYEVDVIGWGTTSVGGPFSTTLQKVSLKIAHNEACSNYYATNDPIFPTQICTYDAMGTGKDSCKADSGGPVIYQNNRQFLVGIISFGILCGYGPTAMAVNTRVSSYLQWINENTNNSTCNRE